MNLKPLNDIVPQYIATSIHYSKEERIRYIILKLFESNTPTSSNTLADMVSVTRRTIVEDLKSVQTWLSSYNLNLKYIKTRDLSYKVKKQIIESICDTRP